MIFEEQIISVLYLCYSSKMDRKGKETKKSEKLLLNYAINVNSFEKLFSLSINL